MPLLQGPLSWHLLASTAQLPAALLSYGRCRHEPPLWRAHLHHPQLPARHWQACPHPGVQLGPWAHQTAQHSMQNIKEDNTEYTEAIGWQGTKYNTVS